MAFTLPAAVLDQTAPVSIKIPVALLNQSAPVGILLPVALLNQSVGVDISLPAAILNQSALVGIKLPALELGVATNAIIARLTVPEASIVIGLPVTIDAGLSLTSASISAVQTNVAQIAARLLPPVSNIVAGENAIKALLTVPTANIVVRQATLATIDAKLLPISAAISTTITGRASIDATLLPSTAQITVNVGTKVSIDAKLLPAVSDISAHPGTTATIAGVLYVPRADVRVAPGLLATIDATLLVPEADIFAGIPPEVVEQIITLVMNTRTSALTEYGAYPFNSFARWQGKTLGASSDGLFELDFGGNDNGAKIAWNFATGEHDFGIANRKVLEKLYAGFRANGDVKVKVTTDEGDTNEYVLEYGDTTTIKQRRVKLGKGARGKYWQLEMEGVDGVNVEFDSFDVGARALSMKV